MKKTTKTPAIKNDYQMNLEIAEKVINIIESGNVEDWKKAWLTINAKSNLKKAYNLVVEGYLAINVYTKEEYNPFIVMQPGFYVTFKQIKENKLHLNKGSKGVANYKPCTFYKYLTKNEEEALNVLLKNNEELKAKIQMLKEAKVEYVEVEFKCLDSKNQLKLFKEKLEWNAKYSKFTYKRFQWVLEYLFHAEDCGINVKELWNIKDEDESEKLKELKVIENVENVKNSYIERSKLKYNELLQDEAYYQQSSHKIVMPLKNQFETIEKYYQTMFHEFAHSTGHPSLLNRKTLVNYCGFGSTTYSKEELVAELSSMYTLSALDIMNNDILKNSISYLKSWGSTLKDGIKHNILNTIRQSRNATNLILNIKE